MNENQRLEKLYKIIPEIKFLSKHIGKNEMVIISQFLTGNKPNIFANPFMTYKLYIELTTKIKKNNDNEQGLSDKKRRQKWVDKLNSYIIKCQNKNKNDTQQRNYDILVLYRFILCNPPKYRVSSRPEDMKMIKIIMYQCINHYNVYFNMIEKWLSLNENEKLTLSIAYQFVRDIPMILKAYSHIIIELTDYNLNKYPVRKKVVKQTKITKWFKQLNN